MAILADVPGLRQLVERRLREQLEQARWPSSLTTAVGYSLLAGGKRLRPVLTLLANDVCGGASEGALPAACAIEMVHTYSLIHDDLPSMDDDDFRRGRPTSHRVFGEALAILAGDCLLTLAFETLSASPLQPDQIAEQCRVLALAAGGTGMVGGQVLDLAAERGPFPAGPDTVIPLTAGSAESAAELAQQVPPGSNSVRNSSNPNAESRVEDLTQIHKMKTGALIRAALELGAISARATGLQRTHLRKYGDCIGLAFQIADDVLDVTGDRERIGKTPGRDMDLGKLTYPALLGLENSQRRAIQLVQEACDAVQLFGEHGTRLKELARFIVERDH
jgi:geranylgeranyl diphosphate synthase, type II